MDDQQLPPRDDATWIQAYSGKKMWPLNPRPEDLDIRDIAHALSMMNRYTGHTHFPYSVAQHCVLMYDALKPKLEGYTLDVLRWALLHDASEAYIADVARPIKKGLGGYEEYEERLMRCIAKRWALSWPMPGIIKEMDLVMLATERHQLMPGETIPWASTEGVEAIPCKIEPWGWAFAKKMFLDRFKECYSLGEQKRLSDLMEKANQKAA